MLSNLQNTHERIGKLGEGYNGIADLWQNKLTKELIVVKVTAFQAADLAARELDSGLPDEISSLLAAGRNAYITEPLDYEVNQDGYRIALHYYDCGTLADLRSQYDDRKEHVPEELVWHVFCQILNGLALLHTKEIYHADIWEKNILLTYPRSEDLYPDVFLADFGCAQSKEVARSLKANATKSEAWFFSTWKLAMERDLRDVGMMMYFLLLGNDFMLLRKEQVVGNMWWPMGHGPGNPAYSTELRRILKRAQDKGFDNRPTAESLLGELQVQEQILSERAFRGNLPKIHLPLSRADEMLRQYDAGLPVEEDDLE
ncbi:kinase-like protein [Saccharata proteae CBS 121410]|uniref:Kinase-like protein n=1 Tax=Saccharata proteae CBS 121410 TaxID=1314787 RepID=A0A6A5YBF8_9PEZI|nr:kinase-like protein [Saccharata proteae CBS 121410]